MQLIRFLINFFLRTCNMSLRTVDGAIPPSKVQLIEWNPFKNLSAEKTRDMPIEGSAESIGCHSLVDMIFPVSIFCFAKQQHDLYVNFLFDSTPRYLGYRQCCVCFSSTTNGVECPICLLLRRWMTFTGPMAN